MKTLQSYIIESYGQVKDINSWDKLVDHISKTGELKVTDKQILPPWINSVELIKPDYKTKSSYSAAYIDNKSKLVGDKLDVIVEIRLDDDFSNKMFISNLQHELQHAFDDWMSRTKKQKYFLSDHYSIGTGGELEEMNPFNAMYDTKQTNCDDIFCMFKWCTYFLETTEVNAYSREFDKWLDTQKELDLNELLKEHHDDIGINPLAYINLLYFIIEHQNDYIEDADHVDWDYISQILHMKWSIAYLGKNISGKNGKDVVIKTIQEILKKYGKYAVVKYRKVIEQHIANKRLKVKFPIWWKKY